MERAMTIIHDTPLTADAQPPQTLRLGSLAEDMVYKLPGCADLMIRKELQVVASDFCRRTGIFIVEIRSEFDDADVAVLRVPFSAFIRTVLSVKTGSIVLRPGAYRVSGNPATLTLLESMVQPLDDDPSVFVEATLEPMTGCEDYPDDFIQRWGYGIISGTLARLFAMSKKPWSDPAQSALESAIYQNALTAACLEVRRRGIGSGDLHCRSSRPWFL